MVIVSTIELSFIIMFEIETLFDTLLDNLSLKHTPVSRVFSFIRFVLNNGGSQFLSLLIFLAAIGIDAFAFPAKKRK